MQIHTMLTTQLQSIRKNGQFGSNSKAYKSCGNGCAQNYKKKMMETIRFSIIFSPRRVSSQQSKDPCLKECLFIVKRFCPLKARLYGESHVSSLVFYLLENTLMQVCTVLENHRKSLIQHCERNKLGLHFKWTKVHYKCQKWSILQQFEKPGVSDQTV